MQIKKPMGKSKCRFCKTELKHTFVDLGMSPLCQTVIAPQELNKMESFYPLRVYVCEECFLVQLEEYVAPEYIFSEYAYFSSYADMLLKNAQDYVNMMVQRFQFEAENLVIEVGSNDGYLLQYFIARGIPVLGIEPASNVAKSAADKGIPTVVKFFGEDTARRLANSGKKADLVVANNLLAQVPDLNGVMEGFRIILGNRGVLTVEFPHIMSLIEGNLFDTIYHEHYSYFSFTTAEKIFADHGLRVFDVEEIETHGGSLRMYVCHVDDNSKAESVRVRAFREREEIAGLTRLSYYADFGERVKKTKRVLLNFLIKVKEEGKTIVGYGAPGKATTLLNYCGIRTDFLDYVVDRNPYKQGKYTPGTRIPIFEADKINETRPDYVLILPWNLKDEIMGQMAHVLEWGGKFVVPLPEFKIYS